MMQLLGIELYKIFRRPRTYIAFATVTAFTSLIQLALYTNGQEFMNFFLQGVSSQFELGGNLMNGYLVTYVILGMLIMQIPLLVALVSGDAIAGEAGAGTLRLLLTKPISRANIILAKYGASVVYCILLLLWLAICTLVVSVIIFGTGDLAFGKSDQVIILLRDDILWRYACAFAFAALSMASVSALALFLSVMADNSIGPIVGTMGVVIVFTIVANLDVSLFNAIRPYMFTSHMLGWKGFFSDPLPTAALIKSVGVLLAYIAGFLGLTIYLFNRKDIQT